MLTRITSVVGLTNEQILRDDSFNKTFMQTQKKLIVRGDYLNESLKKNHKSTKMILLMRLKKISNKYIE